MPPGWCPRPRVVLVKPTDDAHENPTLQIDDAGHVWIFSNTHGPAGNSYIFRSTLPYSIDEFEEVLRTNFSYSQPHVVPGEGFLFLHTRYQSGRRMLHWMTSADGREWSAPQPLAQVAQGHYQISQRHGRRVATAFNYHPAKGGLNARTNLYYLETPDMGATWQTADGKAVRTPLTDALNPALVHDYEAENRLVYLKDLNFEPPGRPVILYLTTGGYAPGPKSGERAVVHRTLDGRDLARGARSRPAITTTTMARYTSKETNGESSPPPNPARSRTAPAARWSLDERRRRRQRGRSSGNSRTTADSITRTRRRPVNAHPQFYALWADGNPHEPSESRLYFTDRDGGRVWQLPGKMSADEEQAKVIGALTLNGRFVLARYDGDSVGQGASTLHRPQSCC